MQSRFIKTTEQLRPVVWSTGNAIRIPRWASHSLAVIGKAIVFVWYHTLLLLFKNRKGKQIRCGTTTSAVCSSRAGSGAGRAGPLVRTSRLCSLSPALGYAGKRTPSINRTWRGPDSKVALITRPGLAAPLAIVLHLGRGRVRYKLCAQLRCGGRKLLEA